MTRDFCGATYRIEIRKRKGICRRRATLTLDGKPLAGNLIPPLRDVRTHAVTAAVE